MVNILAIMILIAVKKYLTIVLINISLIMRDVKQFLYLLTIGIYTY